MAGLSMEQIVFTRKKRRGRSWMQQVASLDACMWWIATSSTLVRLLVKELPSACIRSTALLLATTGTNNQAPPAFCPAAATTSCSRVLWYCAPLLLNCSRYSLTARHSSLVGRVIVW